MPDEQGGESKENVLKVRRVFQEGKKGKKTMYAGFLDSKTEIVV